MLQLTIKIHINSSMHWQGNHTNIYCTIALPNTNGNALKVPASLKWRMRVLKERRRKCTHEVLQSIYIMRNQRKFVIRIDVIVLFGTNHSFRFVSILFLFCNWNAFSRLLRSRIRCRTRMGWTSTKNEGNRTPVNTHRLFCFSFRSIFFALGEMLDALSNGHNLYMCAYMWNWQFYLLLFLIDAI